MAASSGPNNNQTELARENQKLTKVIERLKRLTYSYRSAEVVQKALFRISELAASARSMDNFYQSVHAIIGELMYARNFYVCFYEPEKKVVSFAYFVDEFDEKQAIEQMPMESLARGLTGYVMRTGQSLLCPPEVFQQLIQQGEVEEMGSAPVDWLGVPLISGSNVIGAMVVQSYHDNHRYDENDKDLLTFVSQHVVNALERLKQKEILQNEIAHQTAELRHANESLMKEITVREKVEQQTSVLFAISELTNTSE
ncbi:MAG: GAF domain-containing protein, partial [Pseudomonadota bacterium]|nr:GAF domain-containing protein [Pseudomonadota bacterium]